MIWLRSWPSVMPSMRRFVVDSLPRLHIDNYDYAEALSDPHRPGAGQDNIILVEWDVAFEAGTVTAMEAAAARWPDDVSVAPYRLHPVSTGLSEPVWAHSDGRLPGERWITTQQKTCDHFALGLTYLPRALIDGFLRARPTMADPRMTDTNLSLWHHRDGSYVHVIWDAAPVVHLHW